MQELRICFEVNGLGIGEGGEPCPCGLQISFGETEKNFDYKELAGSINIPELLKATFLEEYVAPENVKIISPEEYDLKYGDDGVESCLDCTACEFYEKECESHFQQELMGQKRSLEPCEIFSSRKAALEDVVDLEAQTRANNEAMQKVMNFVLGE